MPQLRKDPVTREWVIFAEERDCRPRGAFTSTDPAKRAAYVADCPFCSGNEAQTPAEVLAFRQTPGAADSPGWHVRVVPNKYPALCIEGELGRQGLGMYDCMNGVGAHEVIVETPLHNQSFSDVSPDHFADVLWACRQRFVDLSGDRRVKYIVYFRNEGQEAGATLEHSHSQIIALPLVPSAVLAEIEGMNLYAGFRDRCAYCDIASQERASAERIIFDTGAHLVFVPFAAKSAFETWIMPLEHQTSFAELEYRDMEAVGRAVQGAVQRLDRRLNRPAYNLVLRTAPVNTTRPDDFHWHIQISPRSTVTAGFEMGTGVYINTISPEQAAKMLREVDL